MHFEFVLVEKQCALIVMKASLLVEGHDVEKTGMSVDEMVSNGHGKNRW